jgi:uncharacterized protein (TIGR00288 family)
LALFCDFENIALGVRDSKYADFDMRRVVQKLLVKGSIVVKKTYCDWERYKSYKTPMHEAAFELIEIPHVRQSGQNSADIRMVVDALDLCYTKEHIDTFVIISGDSDFSPLVSKLRENAKTVIGLRRDPEEKRDLFLEMKGAGGDVAQRLAAWVQYQRRLHPSKRCAEPTLSI